jgi:dienelactone hydrolase
MRLARFITSGREGSVMTAAGIVLIGAPDSAAARFAQRGYPVLASEPGDDAVRAAIAALGPVCGGRVAVVGYGVGGCSAFLAVTRLGAAAGIGFHPIGIGARLREAGLVRAPLSLHFGDADALVPLPEVRAIKGALEGFATTEIYRYPGAAQGFAVDGDPAFDPAAAALAERRAFDVLDALR